MPSYRVLKIDNNSYEIIDAITCDTRKGAFKNAHKFEKIGDLAEIYLVQSGVAYDGRIPHNYVNVLECVYRTEI